jgi:hypothetical protein
LAELHEARPDVTCLVGDLRELCTLVFDSYDVIVWWRRERGR